jgi:hypothetical protein
MICDAMRRVKRVLAVSFVRPTGERPASLRARRMLILMPSHRKMSRLMPWCVHTAGTRGRPVREMRLAIARGENHMVPLAVVAT